VDDPCEWERIAATNALSDVYAMAELDHRLLAEVR
jgi:selenophosphate synthase